MILDLIIPVPGHCLLSTKYTYLTSTSRKRLRTKVIPDFHLHIVKKGGIWGRNQNDKNG